MGIFKPQFDTYQDVRTTLVWWSTAAWFATLAVIYHFVLPPAYRVSLKALIPGVAEWVDKTTSVGAGLVLAAVLGHFLIEVLELHDRWYDRYVVRWRRNYDVCFILPRILQPYQARMDLRVWNVAQEHRREFMTELFYRFVADRDTKIRKNLLVRFYEVITRYWLTQVVELAAIVTAISAVLYSVVDALRGLPLRASLYWVLVGSIMVFGMTRGVAIVVRRRVRRRTEEEITDIHESCSAELERALKGLCDKYGVTFR